MGLELAKRGFEMNAGFLLSGKTVTMAHVIGIGIPFEM
jgi:hypothetical protein